MRRIIAFIGSLAVGLLMAAAGLYYDASTLAYAGIILFGLAAVLWLVKWGKTDGGLRMSKDQALFNSVGQACEAAGVALGLNDPAHIERTVHLIDSAVLSVAKRFKIARPRLPDHPADALRVGVDYLAAVMPYVQEGHRHIANRKALEFVRRHGIGAG